MIFIVLFKQYLKIQNIKFVLNLMNLIIYMLKSNYLNMYFKKYMFQKEKLNVMA